MMLIKNFMQWQEIQMRLKLFVKMLLEKIFHKMVSVI